MLVNIILSIIFGLMLGKKNFTVVVPASRII
jgi:hypothetical protein